MLNAHLAAALQALREPETETVEQTNALNQAIELLQAPVTADTAPAAAAPTLDPEALNSAIAAAMLLYVGSDDFKKKLADAITSAIGEDDDQAEETRIKNAVTDYFESGDGLEMLKGDLETFLTTGIATDAIKAAVAELDPTAPDLESYFASEEGATTLETAIDKKFAADIADPETPLGKLAAGHDELAETVAALPAAPVEPAPAAETAEEQQQGG